MAIRSPKDGEGIDAVAKVDKNNFCTQNMGVQNFYYKNGKKKIPSEPLGNCKA